MHPNSRSLHPGLLITAREQRCYSESEAEPESHGFLNHARFRENAVGEELSCLIYLSDAARTRSGRTLGCASGTFAP